MNQHNCTVQIQRKPTVILKLVLRTPLKKFHLQSNSFARYSFYLLKLSPPLLKLQLSSRRFIRLPNLREKAVFHEKLGRGGYGSVYRITLGGLACALKKIDIGNMKDQQRQYALQEVQVMETLQHENIIHYLGHELLEDKNELHILMELFPISLGQLIEKRRKTCSKFCSSEIKHIAIEILNGLDHLHNQSPTIIHRDLKPGMFILFIL